MSQLQNNAAWLIASLLLVIGYSQVSHAEDIVITADSAWVDQINKHVIYKGNVRIERGDLLLEADNVEYSQEGAKRSFECTGKPVKIQWINEGTTVPSTAEAMRVTYVDSGERHLNMRGAVRVSIDESDKLEGENVQYNLTKKVLQAEGKPGARVRFVIKQDLTLGQ